MTKSFEHIPLTDLPHRERVAAARACAVIHGRVGTLDRTALGDGTEAVALSFAYAQVDELLAELVEALLLQDPPGNAN